MKQLILEKLVYKNAIKPKIGDPPGNLVQKDFPEFSTVCIYLTQRGREIGIRFEFFFLQMQLKSYLGLVNWDKFDPINQLI
jgi:hypothetical protein